MQGSINEIRRTFTALDGITGQVESFRAIGKFTHAVINLDVGRKAWTRYRTPKDVILTLYEKKRAVEGRCCTKCGMYKTARAFPRRSEDGKLDSWCKVCRSEWHKHRRRSEPEFREKARQYQVEYRAALHADPAALAAHNEKRRIRRAKK